LDFRYVQIRHFEEWARTQQILPLPGAKETTPTAKKDSQEATGLAR
jgi:hypothetical protein